MTPEEYLKSKQKEHFNGKDSYYIVTVGDAKTAVEMARRENETPAKNTGIFGQQGWICPKCGRVYSPFTSMCSFCSNGSNFNVTCLGK
jgi:hypothetical protein